MEVNNIVSLTEDNFSDYISSEIPILVDFYADWCAPCQRMLKIIPRLAESVQGRALIGKVNVDEQMNIRTKYQVKGIPTFILFEKGEVIERWAGIKTLLEMQRIIESHI